jgi:hypothetical protein
MKKHIFFHAALQQMNSQMRKKSGPRYDLIAKEKGYGPPTKRSHKSYLVQAVVRMYYQSDPSNETKFNKDRSASNNQKAVGAAINALCNGFGSAGVIAFIPARREREQRGWYC